MNISNKDKRRSTLTQSTFNQCVDDMMANNITPTTFNIRQQIGGSHDSISEFLEHWKKQPPLRDNFFAETPLFVPQYSEAIDQPSPTALQENSNPIHRLPLLKRTYTGEK